MTSRQFLDWLEAKFAEHGVEKVVPDEATLANAYQHLARNAVLQREIDKILVDLPAAETFTVPEGLAETLRTTIAGTPRPGIRRCGRLRARPSMRMATPSSRPPHDSARAPVSLGAAHGPRGLRAPGRLPGLACQKSGLFSLVTRKTRHALLPLPARTAHTPVSPACPAPESCPRVRLPSALLGAQTRHTHSAPLANKAVVLLVSDCQRARGGSRWGP